MLSGEQRENQPNRFLKSMQGIPDDVPRDPSGEDELCQEITQAMRALDAAGATGILTEEKVKNDR